MEITKNSVKVRSANYTPDEKLRLMNIVHKYKNIIECKATNGSTWHEKNSAWETVAAEFNSESPNHIPRDKESLKKCYENKKRDIRKIAAVNKQEGRATGGGKYTPIDDPCLEIVMDITNKKTIEGFIDEWGGDAKSEQSTAGSSSLIQECTNDVLQDESVNVEMEYLPQSESTTKKVQWNSYKAADLRKRPKLELQMNAQRRRPRVIQPVHTNILSKQYSDVATLKAKYLENELEIIEIRHLRDMEIIEKKEQREQEEFLLRKRSIELDIEIKELQ